MVCGDYLDDVVAVMPIEHVQAYVDRFEEVLQEAQLGLEVNRAKSKVLLPKGMEVTALAQGCLPYTPVAHTVILGKPLGPEAFCEDYLMQRVVRTEGMIDMTETTKIPLQEALLLVRYCIIPRIMHLFRSPMSDATTERPAARFDESVIRLLWHLLDVDPDTHPDTHMTMATLTARLPLREGGLGLTPMADARTAAKVAALLTWWQTRDGDAPRVKDLYLDCQQKAEEAGDSFWGTDLEQQVMSTCQNIQDKLAEVEQPLTSEAAKRYPTVLENFPKAQAKFQRTLTAQQGLLRKHYLWEILPDDVRNKARIMSQSEAGSSGYLAAIPSDGSLTLEDDEMAVSVRMQLGLRPLSQDKDTCPQCLKGDQEAHHVLHCVAKSSMNRHDALRDDLVVMAKEAGFQRVQVERLVKDNVCVKSKLRSDIRINDYPKLNVTCDMDLTVVDPQADTYIQGGSARHGLRAATMAAKRKISKYKVACAAINHSFVPVPIESTGAMGLEMLRFVRACQGKAGKKYCSYSHHVTTWMSNSFSKYWVQRLSINLHRSNARAILAWQRSLVARLQELAATGGGDPGV